MRIRKWDKNEKEEQRVRGSGWLCFLEFCFVRVPHPPPAPPSREGGKRRGVVKKQKGYPTGVPFW